MLRNLLKRNHSTATIQSVLQKEDAVQVCWSDQKISTYHNLWMRDQCRCPHCLSKSGERIYDTFKTPLNIAPEKIIQQPNEIQVIWKDYNGQQHTSTYSASFLKEHCYSSINRSTKHYNGLLWKVKDFQKQQLPQLSYNEIMNTDEGLINWLELVRKYGFSLINDVPFRFDSAEKIATRISFLKETFWGQSWSVKSEPNPKNVSLTGHELHPHTDFVWSDLPPGLQFLHCLHFKDLNKSAASRETGLSTLVDGYTAAEELRRTSPESFRLLCEVPIRHNFSSDDETYSCRHPTITLDDLGNVKMLRFNQANRAPLDVAPHLILPVYKSLRKFTELIRSPSNLLHFRLQEGQMLVFNNHRLLHGRTAYNPQDTIRHLKGCYLDLEEFESRYSILQKQMVPTTNRKRGLLKQQQRMMSTRPTFDPGFENYNEKFVKESLKKYESVMDETYNDGSCLRDVVENGAVQFRALKDGTKADFLYQCSLFQHDIDTNLVNRISGMLQKLEGDHIRLGTGAQVDLFEHSVQCATRAHLDGCDEEMVVVALLHDIGEMMSPLNHGDIAGAILKPYIDPKLHWLLNHHEIFQGYYYFHHVGGNPDTRDIYAKEYPTEYKMTVDFCEKYDQPAFDPDYESYSMDFFKPMLKKVLSRQPYWFQPNHPKLGVVTIQEEI